MNTRLCTYEDLTSCQREQLREIQVHPEQIAFSGDIECALYSLPAQPHPAIRGFVLLSDERPVAFLLLKRQALLAHWAAPDSATLHALQVDKRVQGQGLGKACLRELPQAVNQLWPEVRQLMLSVSPVNASALAFYLGQGWVEQGEAYSGERRLVLSLTTAPPLQRHAG
ncbi:MAG: GNAT family N-acetyltransferase [Pseudomonadota bacterium]